MCDTCGCGDSDIIQNQESDHIKDDYKPAAKIAINKEVLQKNNKIAQLNRVSFKNKDLFVINIISSPGSGKTSILEAMAKILGNSMTVIVGDQQTDRDAKRIFKAGGMAYQIETAGACHLNAQNIYDASAHLDFSGKKILAIENVGNLICPAIYDLGEDLKIAVLSLPEGDDKVLKYPHVFSKINTLLINKTDLALYLDFNPEKVITECKSLRKNLDVFRISAKTGEGIEMFCRYLMDKRDNRK